MLRRKHYFAPNLGQISRKVPNSFDWFICKSFQIFFHIIHTNRFIVLYEDKFYIRWFWTIYCVNNYIRTVFFSKFECLFKKNMYHSIIQSIVHLTLQHFPIFSDNLRILPIRTASAWWARMNQANYWYAVLMWIIFKWGRSASSVTNGSHKG